MNVDFNNLRKQAVLKFDSLTKKLNASILRKEAYGLPNEVRHGQEINIEGYVLIDVEDIQTEMDDLRMLIGTIASVFEPESEDFKDVFSEMFPEEQSGIACFNEEN